MVEHTHINMITEILEEGYTSFDSSPRISPLVKGVSVNQRASTYGIFVEDSMFGMSGGRGSSRSPDMQAGDLVQEKGVELKVSTGQKKLTFGKITLYTPIEDESYLSSAKGQKALKRRNERNIAILFKLWMKMQNLLLFYTDEKQYGNTYRVGFVLIRLYYLLSLKKLSDDVKKSSRNALVKVEKKTNMKKKEIAETYKLSMTLGNKGLLDLEELYGGFHDFLNENGFNGANKISRAEFFYTLRNQPGIKDVSGTIDLSTR